MNHERQSGENYGSLKALWLALAADYPDIIEAISGAVPVPQPVLDQYFHKVEFEFEQASYQLTQVAGGVHGDHGRHLISIKLARWNSATRAFHKFWWQKEIVALAYDFMGNELMIGSSYEVLRLQGQKPGKKKVTQGSDLMIKITGDTASLD